MATGIKKRIGRLILGVLIIWLTGMLLPQRVIMPVEGAGSADYHPQSFWYHPWGRSGTHKGVDIFAKKGTPVNAATYGLVVYTGQIGMGGNVVLVLGPKWRMHYYAHLDSIKTGSFSWLSQGENLGTVGNSGNAAGKPAHLHYTIATPIPYPWRADSSPQGWKKMFYLNPIHCLRSGERNR